MKQILLMIAVMACGAAPAAPKPAKAFTNTLGMKFVPVPGTEISKDAVYASLEGLAEGSEEAQERQKKAVAKLPLEIKLTKSSMVFRLIPSGEFMMGSPKEENGRDDDEAQKHVKVEKPFHLGKFEVTQAQWKQVMGSNPSHFKEAGMNAPVEQVSSNECLDFARKLEKLEGLAPSVLGLPSEMQWEYACRAGTTSAFCFGNNLTRERAIFDDDGKKTNEVGSFPANAFGLHDMHGNVYEWCSDSDPKRKSMRIIRGGSFLHIAEGSRSANRSWYGPNDRAVIIGFRLLLRMDGH